MSSYRHSSSARKRYLTTALAGTALVLLGAVSFASAGAMQNRRITLEEARSLAQKGADSELPIVVNDLVLDRLNRLVGSPEGRRQTRAALARLPRYRAFLEGRIEARGLPSELLAVPFYESDFDNDAVSPPPYRAAGLWQFIPETARTYGLRVNDFIDERRDVPKATGAALTLLKHLREEFDGDWLLALKSYNEGEDRVRRLMNEYNTRDAWRLERALPQSRPSYLAGFMAKLIVLRNPQLVE